MDIIIVKNSNFAVHNNVDIEFTNILGTRMTPLIKCVLSRKEFNNKVKIINVVKMYMNAIWCTIYMMINSYIHIIVMLLSSSFKGLKSIHSVKINLLKPVIKWGRF